MVYYAIMIWILTLVSSLLFTKLAMKIARKYNIGDMPNKRKVHREFMPYLGGSAILFSVILGVAISVIFLPDITWRIPQRYYWLGLSCFVMALMGLVDDIKNINFKIKFLIQIAMSLVALKGFHFEEFYIPFWGYIHLGYLSPVFILLWIVFITNAMNLLDGLDGLASGVSVIIFLTFFVLAMSSGQTLVALICMLMIAGILGFMKYNYHPAKIFMGDAGSLLLGFSIAIISLEVARIDDSNNINIFRSLMALSIPALDTGLAFFRRLSRRMHPFLPDKEHIHHRLLAIGFSHKRAVWVVYFLSLVASLLSISFLFIDEFGTITIIFVAGLFYITLIRELGYIELDRNLITIGGIKRIQKGHVDYTKNDTKKVDIPFNKDGFLQTFIFIISDIIFSLLAFALTALFIDDSQGFLKIIQQFHWMIPVWLTIFWIILMKLNDLYNVEWDTSRVDEIIGVSKIVILGLLTIFIIGYFTKLGFIHSKEIWINYGTMLIILLNFGRIFIISILKKYKLLEFKDRPTLIVGSNKEADKTITRIKNVPELKFDFVGYIDNELNPDFEKLPYLGNMTSIPEIIQNYNISEVIIALDHVDQNYVMSIINIFHQYGVSVKLLPGYYNLLSGYKTSHVYGVSLIKFFTSNMKTWEWITKRLLDIFVSLFFLILFSPLWLLVSILIKLDSKGPIIFNQKRIGKNNQEFKLFKFRTMVNDAEKETGPVWAEKDDPRITKVGRFLRKYKIDEVPQFFNVLIGDMSIVGPRPEREYFVEKLEKEIQFYSRRLIVKPGITGWAQIKHKYDETIDDVKEKLRYDLYYIENMSLLLDVKIIIQTLLLGFRKNQHH